MLAVIDQDVAGMTDVNGSFVMPPVAPSPTMWAALKATFQTVGQARWSILVGGAPKAFAPGDRIDVPILVQPAQMVSVQVQNAVAGQPITGKIHGMAGSTLEEVAPFVSLAPTPMTVDLASTAIFQGPLQGSGGGTNLTLSLPATCFAILVVATAVDANSHVKITGLQSGNTYLDTNLVVIGQQVFAPSAGPFDPRDFAQDAIQVTVSNAVTTNTAIYLVCKGAVIPTNTKSIPLHVLIDAQPITVQGPGFGGVLTVQPAAGFAAQAGELALLYAAAELSATGSTVLVTGTIGKVTKLFGWSMEADQAGGTCIGWLEDTTSPAGTISARMAVFSSPGNTGGSGNESGKPTASGQGIRFNVPLLGAAGVVRCTIGYRQE